MGYMGNRRVEFPDEDQPTQELAIADFEPDPLNAHRVARYLELGFTQVDSIMLAAAKDPLGFALWHGHVKAKLAQGCTHAQAVAIFA